MSEATTDHRDDTAPSGLPNDGEVLASDIARRLSEYFAPNPGIETILTIMSEAVKTSLQDAFAVPCVGMPVQIPLSEIYQPSHLSSQSSGEACPLESLLAAERDRIILAGPGIGKTTFMNYIMVESATRRHLIPLLFLLRGDGVPATLINFVAALREHKKQGLIPNAPLLLLIDGYDEISAADRFEVAKTLREYQRLRYGTFYLSCRLHYDLGNLSAALTLLHPFDHEDAARYAACFFRYAERSIDAVQFIEELIQRKLFDLTKVPLLLSLACVVKAESTYDIPTNAIDLLEQAVELLNDKWDRLRQVKGRDRIPAFSPRRRLILLKRIAAKMSGHQAPDALVEAVTTQFLSDNAMTELDPPTVMDEIAQSSGLMRRTADHKYEFMHASIHDFLAAKYDVETGQFFPTRIDHWDSRAGFAACLSGNATQSMIWSLRHGIDNIAFNDCLRNGATFDAVKVGREVVHQLRRFPSRVVFLATSGKDRVDVRMSHDFISAARTDLVEAILAAALLDLPRTSTTDVLVAYCLLQLKNRKRRLEGRSKQSLIDVYGSAEYQFCVHAGQACSCVRVSEVS